MTIGITLTSSLGVGEEYIALTRAVARTLAEHRHAIAYGGTAYGMMLELADAYREAGGNRLIGIMAKDLIAVTKNYERYPRLDEEYLMDTMGSRKEKLIELSDGFLILPGGYGTMEELADIIGGKANKLYDKPIAVYNHRGFYDMLFMFLSTLFEKQFTKVPLQDLVFSSENLEEILRYLITYRSTTIPDKFID